VTDTQVSFPHSTPCTQITGSGDALNPCIPSCSIPDGHHLRGGISQSVNDPKCTLLCAETRWGTSVSQSVTLATRINPDIIQKSLCPGHQVRGGADSSLGWWQGTGDFSALCKKTLDFTVPRFPQGQKYGKDTTQATPRLHRELGASASVCRDAPPRAGTP
jgi:hypothetical protein